jgi:hypothetical protein
MPTGRGFQHIMGIKAETTLGTVVAVDKKVAYISDTLDQQYQHIQNQALLGTGAPKNSIQSTRQVGGSFQTYWTYALIDPLLKQFFGTHTVNASGDDHYAMDENIDGKGLTIAINKQVSVHEYAGFKLGEMTISGSPTDGVRLGFSGFGMARSLASATNTANVLAALAETSNEMQFHDLTLRIGDLADALAAGDNVQVSGFSLTINRSLKQDQVNSNTLLEALEDGFRTGSLSITLPRHTTDQFITWHTAHTVLQAELAFDNGTDPYKKIRLPQIQVVSAPIPTGGPGLLPATIMFSLHNNLDNANTQTGMTHDQEIRIVEEDGA